MLEMAASGNQWQSLTVWIVVLSRLCPSLSLVSQGVPRRQRLFPSVCHSPSAYRRSQLPDALFWYCPNLSSYIAEIFWAVKDRLNSDYEADVPTDIHGE